MSSRRSRRGERGNDAEPREKLRATCSFVVPCYNEASALPLFMAAVAKTMADFPEIETEYILVDDGSVDDTLLVMKNLRDNYRRVVIVELSRNFGKEAALSAGLAQTSGDAVIPMDADLQDPPSLVPLMIARWREGYDVVLARRVARYSDGFFKRIAAQYFYWLINLISPLRIPPNVGDFRLMSRAAVDAVNALPENCRFMKGLFAFVGFKTAVIEYERPERAAGETKFNFWKLVVFGIDGVTGFSVAPLRLFGVAGFFISVFSLCVALFFFARAYFFGVDVPGYASLIVTSSFLGGVQLLGVGLLGEYLGRTYMESKKRPPYIIREIYADAPRLRSRPLRPPKRVRKKIINPPSGRRKVRRRRVASRPAAPAK